MMKKKQFSESQLLNVLKEYDAGVALYVYLLS